MNFKSFDDYSSIEISNEIGISDDKIKEIQEQFSFITEADPQQIDQNIIKCFQLLDQYIKENKEIYKILPKILPTSSYPHYISFLNTPNSQIHQIISKILVILTSDVTNSLLELSKYNILDVINDLFTLFPKYQNSIHSLFQIITNYLDDPNDQVSLSAHNIFPIEYLYKILQYIKGHCKQHDQVSTDLLNCEKSIINKWIKCICASLSRYPNDIRKNDVTIILWELAGRFNMIQEDSLLSQNFCQIVTLFLELNIITFTDFNVAGYPSFIYILSQKEDIRVKVCAFCIIGKLISINRFPIETNFLAYFNIVKNADSSSDNQSLLTASIYVCTSFLLNNFSADGAFNCINENADCLLHVYDDFSFEVKKEMISLFLSYASYALIHKSDVFDNYSAIITEFACRIFDIIESEGSTLLVGDRLKSLHDLIQSSANQSPSSAFQEFIHFVSDRVKHLCDSNNENTSGIKRNQQNKIDS